MFGIFKRGKKKDKGRGDGKSRLAYNRLSRDDIPQPKGKFRNLFVEMGMVPESLKAKPDARRNPTPPKSE